MREIIAFDRRLIKALHRSVQSATKAKVVGILPMDVFGHTTH